MTVIGLIDVEHLLHRLTGKTDLFADHLGAVSYFHLDPCQLDTVCLFRRNIWKFFCERTERAFISFGPIKRLRFVFDLLLAQSFHNHRFDVIARWPLLVFRTPVP
jgi:hypothetical protein